MVTAIRANLASPAFSLKSPEAFQVSVSLPIPQPSSLVGALAYVIALNGWLGVERALETVKGLTLAARASLETPHTAVNPVILRRFRVLDKGFEAKRAGEVTPMKRAMDAVSRGDFSEEKRILESELTDALYREYLGPVSFACVWVLKEPIKSELIRLIQRLGDTESLCTVKEVWTADCRLASLISVKTRFPFPTGRGLSELKGDFLLLKMCDERREMKNYVVPCRRKVMRASRGMKLVAYSPSEVEASFESQVLCYEVDGDLIIKG